MKRLWFGLLELCVLAGCASSGRTLGDVLGTWREDTQYGQVTVRQMRSDDGACIWREITLHREVGLWIDGRPTYVRAMDYGCDDVIDLFYFRSTHEAQRANINDLQNLLIYLMYQVMPIDEHAKQK